MIGLQLPNPRPLSTPVKMERERGRVQGNETWGREEEEGGRRSETVEGRKASRITVLPNCELCKMQQIC